MLLMHANEPRGHPGGLCRRHRRAGGPEGHHDRRHAVRRRRADHPRADGIPRAGDRAVGRAEDQGRPGEDGRRAQSSRARGSVVPRVDRPRDRPDHHQGDGRAPPRDPGRPHEARVQGRGQCRRAAGGVSRVSREAGRRRLHPQEAVGRLRPVRPRQGQGRRRASAARASSSSTRSRAATFRRNISRRSRRASARRPRPAR